MLGRDTADARQPGRRPSECTLTWRKQTESKDMESTQMLPGWWGPGSAHHSQVTLVAWLVKPWACEWKESSAIRENPPAAGASLAEIKGAFTQQF